MSVFSILFRREFSSKISLLCLLLVEQYINSHARRLISTVSRIRRNTKFSLEIV
jgi:hypothetical protein